MEVATHRHVCCVLQRCIDFANVQQRRRLVQEISTNALVLSQVLNPASFQALNPELYKHVISHRYRHL